MPPYSLEGQTAALTSISGGTDLLDWFGYTPTFHDAEILSFHLDRDGPSTLRVHTWNASGTLDKNGFNLVDKHVVVTFAIEQIAALHLEDFSTQNVIGALELKCMRLEPPSFRLRRLHAPHPVPDSYELIIRPCFGLHGLILAHRLSISLAPGKPI